MMTKNLPRIVLAAVSALTISTGVALADTGNAYAANAPTATASSLQPQTIADTSDTTASGSSMTAAPNQVTMPPWESGYSSPAQLHKQMADARQSGLDNSSG